MTEHPIPPANESEKTGKKKSKKFYLWGVIVLLLLLLPFTALTFYVNGYEAIFPNIYVANSHYMLHLVLLKYNFRYQLLKNQLLQEE